MTPMAFAGRRSRTQESSNNRDFPLLKKSALEARAKACRIQNQHWRWDRNTREAAEGALHVRVIIKQRKKNRDTLNDGCAQFRFNTRPILPEPSFDCLLVGLSYALALNFLLRNHVSASHGICFSFNTAASAGVRGARYPCNSASSRNLNGSSTRACFQILCLRESPSRGGDELLPSASTILVLFEQRRVDRAFIDIKRVT